MRDINDPLSIFVKRKGEIGVFGERLQTQTAGVIDRFFSNRTNRTGNNGDAIPASVSPPIEIESARIFE